MPYFTLLGQYNAWMNTKVYDAAATLPAEALSADRGAFFGSILGTLNHLAVADTVWLRRFASHAPDNAALAGMHALAQPAALDAQLFDSLPALRIYRNQLDTIISDWVGNLTEADLASAMSYKSMKGIAQRKQLGQVLQHFFNHQTHHRGQVTTLLTQAGVDVGVTDLVAIIPDIVENS